MAKNDNLLSVKEAAERLNLSEQRVKQLIYDKRLEAQKIGNQWIITVAALDAVKTNPTGRPKKEKES